MHDAAFPDPLPGCPAEPDTSQEIGPDIGREIGREIEELFDAPSRWRSQAATALALRDDELLGAVSPAAGCPAVLASVVASLTPIDGVLSTLVDIGAGVGGVSEWLRRRTAATVIAVEPAEGARDAARTLFPAIEVRAGRAASTGLPDDVADAAVMCGVLSLIDDAGAVFAEAERVVRHGGTLAVADLFSARPTSISSGPNVFRSFEQITAALALRGWSIEELGCGTTAPDARWAAGAERVDRWIHEHRSDHPAYPMWLADRRHLERHVEVGDLVAGCIVARRVRS